MKKIKIVGILFFCFLSIYTAHAQNYINRNESGERINPQRNENHPHFFVKQLYYTVEENIVKITVQFNSRVNPKTLTEQIDIAYGNKKPERINIVYNRLGNKAQIHAVFDDISQTDSFNISFDGVKNNKNVLIQEFICEDLKPAVIYEFTEDGICQTY
ncbi:MAG: hypothetical protein R3Y36_07820 [Spirochaetales bacterium]